ncbi:MAG TPA: hypothetical protein VIL90_06445 [Puia sp.]
MCLLTLFAATHMTSLFAQAGDSTRKKNESGLQIHTDTLAITPRKKIKSRFEAGISYQSNDVYLGRKDSSVLSYFTPVLNYYDKSGLYFSASAGYLSDAQSSRVDVITLEAGYIFTAGNYDGQLNISKLFYNSQSTSVTSEITASAGYQNGYDFGAVKAILNLGFDFGMKTDYSASFGLEHGFSFLRDKLEFTPSVCMNAGTQNFYDNYYKNKRYSNRKNGRGTGNVAGGVTGSVVSPSNFKILDYELSIPFSYTLNKLTFNFTPTYAIPVNPSLIDIQSNGGSTNKIVTEHLTNTLYVTTGIIFRFG